MQHRLHMPRIHGLLPYAVLATAIVVALPAAVVIALSAIGLPDPQVILAGVIGMIFSIGTAAVGTTMWIKRPESLDVSFGELMLWRFFRRHRAEKTIDESTARLGLVSTAPSLDVSPKERLDILHDLAAALEAKDPYTGGHSRRVERHAYRTACALHLPPDEIEDLRLAATLHDVGKIRIPDRVLRKPEALDEAETEMVREHSTLGAALVAPAASEEVIDAIRHHHECWDGSGYPSGLSGEAIPLAARVIAVADAYDAMTSARPYKQGMSRKEAVDVLEAAAGHQFDPVVVEAFVTTLPTALPAAGALLIFAAPAAAAKKASVWLRSVGGGSVASAAGTASVAAIVGAAGVTGAFTGDRPLLRSDRPVAQSAPAAAERSSTEVPAIVTEAEAKKPKKTRTKVLSSAIANERDSEVAVQASTSNASSGSDQSGSEQKQKAPASEPKQPAGASQDPKPEPETPGAPPAKQEDPEGKGHEPHGDPQPDKGNDCPAGDEKGKGRKQHCS